MKLSERAVNRVTGDMVILRGQGDIIPLCILWPIESLLKSNRVTGDAVNRVTGDTVNRKWVREFPARCVSRLLLPTLE